MKDFYAALAKCITYVTFEKDEANGTVLKRSECEIYEWQGEEIIHTSETGEQNVERKFKLVRKNNDNVLFAISFAFHQTEILIKVINELVLTMMCLKYNEKKLIETLINKKKFTNFEDKDVIASIIMEEDATKNLGSLVDLVYFYRDIFKILIATNEMKEKLLHPQFFIDSIDAQIEEALSPAGAQI